MKRYIVMFAALGIMYSVMLYSMRPSVHISSLDGPAGTCSSPHHTHMANDFKAVVLMSKIDSKDMQQGAEYMAMIHGKYSVGQWKKKIHNAVKGGVQ